MKKFLIVPILLLLHSAVSSQVCGGGVFTLQFYILNGTRAEEISYELTPVSFAEFDSLLQRSHYDTLTRQRLSGNVNNTVVLDPAFINITGLLRKRPAAGTRVEAFDDDNMIETLKQAARHFNIPFAIRGAANKGVIQFPTLETYSRYFILKFTAGDTTGYLYGNFFGGCNRTLRLYREPGAGFRRLEW